MADESNSHARKVELSDMSAMMQTASGRRVLARILRMAGLYESTYVPGKPDETIRRSIRRDFAVWLEKELNEATPGANVTLLKEYNENG